MNKLTIDFETYFDADITLKKLNYTEYAAKTHVMCCSISLDDDEPIYLINNNIESTLKSINWPNIELICHNALFDALILKHHYGIEAARYSDTLAASRLLHHTWKHDLAGLATALGLDGKSKQHTALTSVKGMTWDALTVPQQQTLVDYNLNDVRLTKAIYDILWPQVPQIERDIIDHTIKLFLRPALVLDSEMAQLALDEERLETERLINESGLDKTSIRSDTKFSAHLRSLGYETPVKWSVKKSCNIPAFAKNDPSDFYDGNPEIQPLLDLKRRINSNIKESRTERLISSCAIHSNRIPIAYNYCGAFTGRFCLTGDTVISVLRNQEVLDIILPELLPDDLVWDGDSFVSHGGLIDQGIHEVISYDAITGTPDHRVFVEEIPTPIELRRAMEGNYTLKVANAPPKKPTNSTNTN